MPAAGEMDRDVDRVPGQGRRMVDPHGGETLDRPVRAEPSRGSPEKRPVREKELGRRRSILPEIQDDDPDPVSVESDAVARHAQVRRGRPDHGNQRDQGGPGRDETSVRQETAYGMRSGWKSHDPIIAEATRMREGRRPSRVAC